MGRSPRYSKDGLNKGAWTIEEDKILTGYIKIHGEGKWSNVVKETGLKRCGKSCRLRWMNYLRPDIKRGNISSDEEELIIRLHKLLGNRWSLIAGRLPGRTDNEIKNYWNTNLAKKAHDLQLILPKLEKKQTITPRSDNVVIPQELNRAKNIQNVTGPVGYVTHQQANKVSVPTGAPTNTNLSKVVRNIIDHENESSDASPTSTSGDDNSSDFILDFDVEDFCKILDSDFTKLGEIHLSHSDNNVMEGSDHCDINYMVPVPVPGPLPPGKLEENWSGNECVDANQDLGSTDFMSLVSFLDSAEEWPGGALNAHVQS